MISKRFKYDGKPRIKLNDIQLKFKKIVESKIEKDIYSFEKISCAVCNSEKSTLLSEKDRYGFYYRVSVCNNCGLVYTNPRMTQESYNEFYEQEYRQLYVGTSHPTPYFFKEQYSRGKLIYQYISDNSPGFLKEGINVLEIGCGAGGILSFFKDQGCTILGVDPGKEYLEYGREKYNLNLKCGNLYDIDSEFLPDLIIYSHVLEHVLDINAELEQIKKIANDNTLVYVEVPGIKNIHNNYKSDLLLYLQNAHTYHFSLTALVNLFSKHHFNLINGDEYIRSLFRIRENEISILKNDMADVVSYLRKVDRSRYLFYTHPKNIMTKLKTLRKIKNLS